MAGINQDLSDYRSTLITLLITATLFLFFMQFLILRWGLKPLYQLSDDLKEIQTGKKAELIGQYPKELAPLTSNLNHLLKIEQGHRERYKNSLTDLSHSLKTPISVIQGSLHHDQLNNTDKQDIQQQIDRMTNTIRYQLQRSVHGFQGLHINRIPITPIINTMIDAMYKVYADKGLYIKSDIKHECYFHGDENDLMEVIGNLLDNACKYCRNEVVIVLKQANNQLSFEFCDDGSGIP